MLILRADELELEGITYSATSQIVVHNTVFTKDKSFSSSDRPLALEICKKYLLADIVCLIVESKSGFTLWRENKNLNQPLEKIQSTTSKVKPYKNNL